MRLFILIICAIVLLSIPIIPVIAETITIKDPLQGRKAEDIITSITTLLRTLSIGIGTIMIIISGLMYITSAGSQERIEKAKKTMFYTVIGTAIVILASFIIELVKELLNK